MNDDPNPGKDEILRAVALARAERPAYSHLYDFLEALLVAGAEISGRLHIDVPAIEEGLAKSRWAKGSPLLNRWDFPIDAAAALDFLSSIEKAIPQANLQLAHAYLSLKRSIAIHSKRPLEFWRRFLKHETDAREERSGMDSETDPASVLFLAVSAIRPSLELTARRLLETHTVPDSWLKGYCPACGSLPSLLYVCGEGARKAFCSWCATRWDLQRLQCSFCENRHHESLGYIAVEEEPQNRIVYCEICRFYFKQIDLREMAYVPCLPLEEWITLHLDLIARKAGWRQPPSQPPAVAPKTH